MDDKIRTMLDGLAEAIDANLRDERSTGRAKSRAEAEARIKRSQQALDEAEVRHFKRHEKLTQAEHRLTDALKENVLLKQKVEAMGTTIHGLRKNLVDADAALASAGKGSA